MSSTAPDVSADVEQLVIVTKRLWGDEQGCIELEADEALTYALNHLTLVGKLLTDSSVNKNAAKTVIQRAWHPRRQKLVCCILLKAISLSVLGFPSSFKSSGSEGSSAVSVAGSEQLTSNEVTSSC
uniref:Uncharacterized protein n=1 Tax=Opuntia streptacantha TaxID=393608 RepID=A0A7C9ED36_OPUST